MKRELWDSEKIRPQQDLPLNKNALPRVQYTPLEWVDSVLRTRNAREALSFVNKLAVPRFVSRKESIPNPEFEFFSQCKNLLLRRLK